MVNLANVKLDLDLANAGVWHDFPYADGVRFRIASGTNKGFAQAMRQAVRTRDQDGEEAYEKNCAEAFARHILKDWSGLEDGDKPLPYSLGQATAFMVDEDCAHIRNWVANQSQAAGEYLVRSRAEAGKG